MPEKNLDFDTVVDRRGTNSLKYDCAVRRGLPEDVLPFWVADMDFKTSSCIQEALQAEVEHGIFGYSEPDESYFAAVAGWMERHHNYKVERPWLVKTPGIVFALAQAVRAFTDPGDSVLVQQPVYYPFSEVILDNDRKLVSSDLILGDDGQYRIDFADFEKKIVENDVKLFLLCNPHNPGGRVWTREELTNLGDICLAHHVLVVSDEIHSDFAFAREHTVFATIKPEFQENSVIMTAPSKTFNLAALQVSNVFVANAGLRHKLRAEIGASGYSQLNIMGILAAKAAYTEGEEWYEGVYQYIADNMQYAVDYVNSIPGLSAVVPEGTYLLWVDCRGLGLSAEELDARVINRAKLWLDSGTIFGKAGEGFQRINVACPRVTLQQGLERLRLIAD